MAKSKPIALALQGGGAHGAFTWGVLDKLLEDGRLSVKAITGTSAGAMNAAVLAQGLTQNGPDGAREALERFWHALSLMGQASPIKRSFVDMLTGNWSLDASPAYNMLDVMSRIVSPYDTNPFDINPLLDLLNQTIDFNQVRKCAEIELFVSATNVRNGKIKVFNGTELTADMLMASACLPHLYKSVKVDGELYWDGGYMGNPPIFPLFYHTPIADIMIVQINPIERDDEPKTAREIHNRINEITFNSSLLRELRTIDFVTRLIDDGKLDAKQYTHARMHRIEATELINPLSASSKMNTEWEFLCHLRDIGRDTCSAWLDAHYDQVGKSSTLDLRAMFE
ncbi:MAG: patatin-like phospholipase family protein [Pseudomonadota bacterium]